MRPEWWEPADYGDEPPKRSDACRCGDMPGRCPGPANCPMCEEDADDFDLGD